jgi:hypothetical protein
MEESRPSLIRSIGDRMTSSFLVLLASAALAAAAVAAPAQGADPLRAMAACPFGKDLKPVSVNRWAVGAQWRAVQTGSGPMQVSIADGYRMLLAYPGSDPFVNLKLERSAPGKLAQDRMAILAKMTSFAATPGAPVAPFKAFAQNGVEVMALNGRSIDGEGVISMYTLISEKTGVVATVYLLNQKPDRRKFQTFAQYRALRDDFIFDLALCMAEL